MDYLQEIELRVNCLPNKDIGIAEKLIFKRDFEGLIELIDSDIFKAERDNLETQELHEFRAIVSEYRDLSTYDSDYCEYENYD